MKKTEIMDRLERLIDNAMPNDSGFSYDRDVLDAIYNLMEEHTKEMIDEEYIATLPLPEDVEAEAKAVLVSMNIKKGYGRDFTDADILDGLKLMCANYRKYLLKPAK